MIGRLLRRLRALWSVDDRHVSDRWLDQQQRTESTAAHDGPAWRWPVDKRRNESGAMNRWRLRRRP